MEIDNWKIDRVNGHWELFIDEKFICSGDTFAEVLDEFYKIRDGKPD